LVMVSPVLACDIWCDMTIFAFSCSFYLHNLGVTGPIFIKIAQNIAKVLPFNTYKLELQ